MTEKHNFGCACTVNAPFCPSLLSPLFWIRLSALVLKTAENARIETIGKVDQSPATPPSSSNQDYFYDDLQARTGYPFIDAIMTQLRREGWIHHLARHAVACFLTRGDLWISWEEGLKVKQTASTATFIKVGKKLHFFLLVFHLLSSQTGFKKPRETHSDKSDETFCFQKSTWSIGTLTGICHTVHRLHVFSRLNSSGMFSFRVPIFLANCVVFLCCD